MTEKKHDWHLNVPLTQIANAYDAAVRKLRLDTAPSLAVPTAQPDTRNATATASAIRTDAAHVDDPKAADAGAAQNCPWTDLYRLDQEQIAASPLVKSAVASVATALPAAAASPACEGGTPVTVYIQIYDEPTRALAEKARAALKGQCNIVVTPVENVTSSAQVRGTAVPFAWKAPTMIAHLPNDDSGAVKTIVDHVAPVVQRAYGDKTELQTRRLPSSISSTRHVVELWLPPTQKPAQ